MPSIGYLDANAGSLLVAAVVAGFAGLAVFFRSIWQRIRHPFGGGKAEDTDVDLDAVDSAGDTDAPDGESVPSGDHI